ncbi:TPA: tail fiber assembly protein, partial [Yersinia enterocolitica]
FYGKEPIGKIRGVSDGGIPIWVDIPAATEEELIAGANAEKSRLKAIADSEIEWRQDAVDAGIATDEETALLTNWKAYRVQLMRIKTDTAPDIEWPVAPE